MVSSLLIANRGEIACRIIRTARSLGIRTVAVFSDADADAPHVHQADQAVWIGPSPARESYLDGNRVIEAARRTGAEAIHPGYGFLSENADFADACAAAGITFVGPPASAMRAMGGKSTAKAIMADAGVPILPGYHGDGQDDALLSAEADRVGYPIMLKASAGGGGKGMRVVRDAEAFPAALGGARREAVAAFGDDRMLIERYLDHPRHVEVQVFADSHGGCIHLFERDCSIQRRHQKVAEEAPAPDLPPAVREAMGAAAVAAAKAIGYVGAGTVEFLYAPDSGEFFFMEMNTRLQVEHPVTEAVTGVDLVAWQLRIAAGEALPCVQDDIRLDGHAVEVRLYAEDPDAGFLPSTGRLTHFSMPEREVGIRVDSGVDAGSVISVHYDPMIAKIIAHGPDRATALRRLGRALEKTEVAGPATNAAFLRRIVTHPAFAAGAIETGFIEKHTADLLPERRLPGLPTLGAAVAGVLADRAAKAARQAGSSADPWSPWGDAGGWRLNGEGEERIAFRSGEVLLAVTLRYLRDGCILLTSDGIEARLAYRVDDDGMLSLGIDGVWRRVRVALDGLAVTVFDSGEIQRLSLVDPIADADRDAVGGKLVAPMPGRVVALHVAVGDSVKKGVALIVIEAMKMEHTILAPADGAVTGLPFGVGDQVEEGAELVGFESGSPEEDASA
ncbi:acetyl/propionyl/methylcrotonyl-CoA carboxylase subunit alpha [Fodinicurvata sp. EGI_FJ10296]|uniref:acetyl/propionyl/methylcrotonyl-CoA carboxylase subunit alpha n=1 Tax=Fodinicurvata sp. EGI_FJ10296 TaxID=3231908 RepID=UPI003454E85C